MSEFVSVERINSLKSGIEAKTGESYTDLTAGVQALVDGYGQGGGGGSGSPGNLFQTADIVVDNTTVNALVVDLEDDTLDNYAMDAIMIESGVYSDGVLVLDDTPTVPLGQNIPVQCCGVNLKSIQKVNVVAGGTTFDGALSAGSYIIRSAVNAYSGNYVVLARNDSVTIKEGEIGIKSQYAWGKSGYYFKYRVNVYGWNNP